MPDPQHAQNTLYTDQRTSQTHVAVARSPKHLASPRRRVSRSGKPALWLDFLAATWLALLFPALLDPAVLEALPFRLPVRRGSRWDRAVCVKTSKRFRTVQH